MPDPSSKAMKRSIYAKVDSVNLIEDFSGDTPGGAGSTEESFYKFFELAESKDLNVDGSSSDQLFSILPEAGYDIYIKGIEFELQGEDINPLNNGESDEFTSAYNTGLTNGIVVQHYVNGVAGELLTRRPIQMIQQFASLSGAGHVFRSAQGEEDILLVRHDAASFKLSDGSTDELRITISDDLSVSEILFFQAYAWGHKVATA